MKFIFFIVLSLLLSISSAVAKVDLEEYFEAAEESLIPAGERLTKYELALTILGVPFEAGPSFDSFPDPGVTSAQELKKVLAFQDPDGALQRYFNIDAGILSFFQDFFPLNASQDHRYISLPLNDTQSSDSEELLRHLEVISVQVKSRKSQPLKGLRVLIDPGHIGHEKYEVEGKYVKINGQVVREGNLNLWSAFLLANELEKLGAEVRLTREAAVPVNPFPIETFDPSEMNHDYLYRAFDHAWLQKFLAMSESSMRVELPAAPEVAALRTERNRKNMFLRKDLDARMDIFDEYHPDIFFDLHYDSWKENVLQNQNNTVAVFVPGGIGKSETGSKVQRARSLKTLLETRRWNQTVKLGKTAVKTLADSLGLKVNTDPNYVAGSAFIVTDGVYARNLFQTSRADSGLAFLFESFHYDHVSEFPRLVKHDRTGKYRGKTFSYPSRLDAVARGISLGLMKYFESYTLE